MSKMTNKDATIAGLERLGWTKAAKQLSKYLVYERSDEGSQMLVGRLGALRKRASSGTGVSLTAGRYHAALQNIGRRADAFSSTEQAQAEFEFLQNTEN